MQTGLFNNLPFHYIFGIDQKTDPLSTQIKWKKIIKHFIIFPFFAFLLFFLCVILFLPSLISSSLFREQVVEQIQNQNIPLDIDNIECSWTHGLKVKKISLQKDSASKPLLLINDIKLSLNIPKIFQGIISFDFYLDGLNTSLIRKKDGLSNWSNVFPASDDIKNEESKDKIQNKQASEIFIPPFDFESKIHFTNLNILVDDNALDHKIFFKDTNLLLDLPSLFLKPVSFKIQSNAEINNNESKLISIDSSINNIFDSQKKPDLQNLLVILKGEIPGFNFLFNGNMQKVNLSANIDFEKILKILKPFIPQNFSDVQMAGQLNLSASCEGNFQKDINFITQLKGEKLDFTGWILKEKHTGAFNFELNNSGKLHVPNEHLIVDRGEFIFQKKNYINWKGEIDKNTLNGTIIKSKLHIDDILDKITLFNPEISSLFSFNKLAPILNIVNLLFDLEISTGKGFIDIKNMDLNVPALSINNPSLNFQNFLFKIQDTSFNLKSFIPDRFEKAKLRSSSSLVQYNDKKQNFETPFEISLNTDEIRIKDLEQLKISIKKSVLQALLGEMLKLNIELETRDSLLNLHTKGDLLLDLESLSKDVISKIEQKINLSGKTDLKWNFAGDFSKLLSIKSSVNLEEIMQLIKILVIENQVKNINLDYNIDRKNLLSLQSINTKSPIKYSYNSNTGIGSLSASLGIEKIETSLLLNQKKN